jgi:hypothetical protein
MKNTKLVSIAHVTLVALSVLSAEGVITAIRNEGALYEVAYEG